MKAHKTTTAALLALFAVGCAGGDGSWGGSISDSAGVVMVANTDQGIWSSSSQWTLEEELRIGTVEGDPNLMFGTVGMIGVDSEGNLYVMDSQAQRVQVFSADGAFLRTIGRAGGGPGELGAGVAFCLIAAGDIVTIPDLANQRINRFSADGEVLPSSPLTFDNGIPALFRATEGGVINYQVRPMPFPGQTAEPDSMDTILVLNSDGTPGDTIMRFKSGETVTMRGGAPRITFYSPEPAWDVTEDGRVLFGVSDSYRFGVYSNGEPERIITKPFERQPVTENDQQAVISFMEQRAIEQGAPPQALQQLRSIMAFGEFMPAFSAILSGPQGTIWVQHIQSAGELTEQELAGFDITQDAGAPEWDVFDADGRFLGIVTMPSRFSPRGFHGDRIYGVSRDDLDVQYVTRMRIVGIPGMEG
jgi:hypothetical protein